MSTFHLILASMVASGGRLNIASHATQQTHSYFPSGRILCPLSFSCSHALDECCICVTGAARAALALPKSRFQNPITPEERPLTGVRCRCSMHVFVVTDVHFPQVWDILQPLQIQFLAKSGSLRTAIEKLDIQQMSVVAYPPPDTSSVQ